jgi:RNA polymerase sigma-70 factor (ECF subfamily)
LQALSSWPFKGVPDKPAAWLAIVARNRALDLLRHEARSVALADELLSIEPHQVESDGHFDRELNDDELALLFAVCHPALSPEMRVTFALKTVCGLTVQQIASGLLSEPTAIAQRLVRARRQLENAGVAIEAPAPEALPDRAESVRTALYLMFNEGYSASSGEALVQPEFCVEAVRLARALAQHPVTAGPASDALAALLALTAARLPTRVGPDGVAQLLEDQPRSQWDRGLTALGLAHLERSAGGEELTVWHLRAEIASLHATAATSADTDWLRIASIYEHLHVLDPSPVVELARAVPRFRQSRAVLTSKRRAACSWPNLAGATKRERTSTARSTWRARRRSAVSWRSGWRLFHPSHDEPGRGRQDDGCGDPFDRRQAGRGDPADMRGRRFQGDGKERHGGERDQIRLHAGAVDRPEAEPRAGRAEQQAGQGGVEPEFDAAKGVAGAGPGRGDGTAEAQNRPNDNERERSGHQDLAGEPAAGGEVGQAVARMVGDHPRGGDGHGLRYDQPAEAAPRLGR